MVAALAAVFVLVPLLEVYLLIQAGRTIGVWPTLAILVVEAIFGAWLMKREGSRAWAALNAALSRGTMPSRQLADAALVLVGGAMFMLPGFFSDIFGLICLLPFTRALPRRLIAWVAGHQAARHGVVVRAPQRPDVIPGVVVPGDVVPDEKK